MQKVRFGVIGMGVGSEHASHLLRNPRAELFAICDMDPAKLEPERLKNCYIEYKTTDFLEIANHKKIDAVIIATPDHLHCEHIIACLEAGKNVFSEKPLALNLEDCKKIIDAADKAKGKFFVGQVCRYSPGFKMAKQLFDEGVIGDIFFIESEYAHDFERIIRFRDPNHWRRDPKIWRSPFIGGACHAVDLMRWFAGNPVEVTAYANQKCLKDWPNVMDATIAIYKLPNDVIGKVFCSIGCKRPYTMRTVVYGTEGTIVCDNKSSHIKVFSTKWLPEGLKGRKSGFLNIPVDISSHNFAAEHDIFIEAIIENKVLELDAKEGARTVAACVHTVQSAQQSKSMKIPYLYL